MIIYSNAFYKSFIKKKKKITVGDFSKRSVTFLFVSWPVSVNTQEYITVSIISYTHGDRYFIL